MNRTDVNSMWNLSWQMDLKISLSSTNNNHHHRRRLRRPPADSDEIQSKSKEATKIITSSSSDEQACHKILLNRVCLQILTSTTSIAGESRNWLTRFFFNSPTWRIFGGRMRMCVCPSSARQPPAWVDDSQTTATVRRRACDF